MGMVDKYTKGFVTKCLIPKESPPFAFYFACIFEEFYSLDSWLRISFLKAEENLREKIREPGSLR